MSRIYRICRIEHDVEFCVDRGGFVFGRMVGAFVFGRMMGLLMAFDLVFIW